MFGLGRLFDRATGLQREFGPISIHGIQLYCQVCRHGIFWHQKAQLHTRWATFFDLEFANRTADCAVCAQCGYVHWFLPVHLAPQPAGEMEEGDPRAAMP
jgi:hypothetical protein